MGYIKLIVVVLALVICEVLSVPAPPSQPDAETLEKIKRAISLRAAGSEPLGGQPSAPGPAEGDLQTDESLFLSLGISGGGYGGYGWPWGGWGGLGNWGGWPYGGGWNYGGWPYGGWGGWPYGGYGNWGWPYWG